MKRKLLYLSKEGVLYGKNYSVSNDKIPDSLLKRGKFPHPSKYNSYSEFYKSANKWFRENNIEEYYILLPIPVTLSFRYISPPHIPTPQEKIRGSNADRIAAKMFDVKNTPLYPINYMSLLDYVIEGGQINKNSCFPEPGPRGQTIHYHKHLFIKPFWSNQLIPSKPRPQLFNNFREYALSLKRWKESSSKMVISIPHPSEMEKSLCISNQNNNDPIFVYPQIEQQTHLDPYKWTNSLSKQKFTKSSILEIMYMEYHQKPREEILKDPFEDTEGEIISWEHLKSKRIDYYKTSAHDSLILLTKEEFFYLPMVFMHSLYLTAINKIEKGDIGSTFFREFFVIHNFIILHKMFNKSLFHTMTPDEIIIDTIPTEQRWFLIRLLIRYYSELLCNFYNANKFSCVNHLSFWRNEFKHANEKCKAHFETLNIQELSSTITVYSYQSQILFFNLYMDFLHKEFPIEFNRQRKAFFLFVLNLHSQETVFRYHISLFMMNPHIHKEYFIIVSHCAPQLTITDLANQSNPINRLISAVFSIHPSVVFDLPIFGSAFMCSRLLQNVEASSYNVFYSVFRISLFISETLKTDRQDCIETALTIYTSLLSALKEDINDIKLLYLMKSIACLLHCIPKQDLLRNISELLNMVNLRIIEGSILVANQSWNLLAFLCKIVDQVDTLLSSNVISYITSPRVGTEYAIIEFLFQLYSKETLTDPFDFVILFKNTNSPILSKISSRYSDKISKLIRDIISSSSEYYDYHIVERITQGIQHIKKHQVDQKNQVQYLPIYV